MLFLALNHTYSLPSFSPSCFSLLLLLLLSSGFKTLGPSLVPRSNSPLPFLCQPFDVVPAWGSSYARPLSWGQTRDSVLGPRPNYHPPPHPPIELPFQMHLSDAPLSTAHCPPLALPCPSAHYYFIVWFCIPFS